MLLGNVFAGSARAPEELKGPSSFAGAKVSE
jgi:hypothetical protein